MPYKSEKIKIQGTLYDRRRKLTNEQKEQIKTRYKNGGISLSQLAKIYNVSLSTIKMCIYERLKETKKQYIKENWKRYSDREALTEATRKTRRYKQNLFLKGVIKL